MTEPGKGSKEEIYATAKEQHTALDNRLQMLLKKSYLTDEDELEIKVLKKKKLYFKDLMEKTDREIKKGDT